MTENERLEKNKQISQTKADTIARHKSMLCKTYTCKVHWQSLSKKQKEAIERMFLEAKWFKNYILSWSGFLSDDEEYKKTHNIFKFPAQKIKTITHKDKDMNDVQVDVSLHTMIKDQLHADICSNIKTIHTLKKKGLQKNGGALKYKSICSYIPLKKYAYTHRIKSHNRVIVAGTGRKGLVVNGLKQFIDIPGIEVANARLVRRGDGLFIQFVTYQPKQKTIKNTNGRTLGIDFGCSTSFTTSEGEKINVQVQESERLKKTMTRMNRRMKKGSKNWQRCQKIVQKEYQKQTNRKNDIANKIVAKLKDYDTIVIQDEQLSNWQRNHHGKAIQHSVLGRVKSKLKAMPNVVVLGKSIPTTKLCTKCGQYHDELKVWNRWFVCDCGVNEDRDIHAAKNMIWFYDHKVGLERPNFKRVEMEALVNAALSSHDQLLSEKHEVATSLA